MHCTKFPVVRNYFTFFYCRRIDASFGIDSPYKVRESSLIGILKQAVWCPLRRKCDSRSTTPLASASHITKEFVQRRKSIAVIETDIENGCDRANNKDTY